MSSLTRVLEPEVMDSESEANDYNSMDHQTVNQGFVNDLQNTAVFSGKLSSPILDLGTATALLPIELCRRVSDISITAIDLASSMLKVAKENIEQSNLTSRISLEFIDAKGLPYEDKRFAVVMSNSIVHHIPQPQHVLSEAARVLQTGGLIFFRDLLRPSDDDQVQQFVQTYAGDCNDHQRQMFDDSLRAALSLEEIRELIVQLGFQAETVSATSDRHWTWSARKG